MDLDRLIHEKKHFAELDDGDVEVFLRERKFRSEHLNIEFKSGFPQKENGKYEIKKICKYIAGFSNEEGGLIIYGVADNIKDPNHTYPAYVIGLAKHPTLEELSLWLRQRIHPLIASPAIRFFRVAARPIAILKIPPGVNKPYCYYEPDSRSLTFYKKTAGGIAELNPDEIREFYRTQIIEQSQVILRAGASEGPLLVTDAKPDIFSKHTGNILGKLEDPKDYGLVRIYCWPVEHIEIPVAYLKQFLEEHRLKFSESMHYFNNIDVFQKGVSVGYAPNAVRNDLKSTVRFSLYTDGFVAFDALADTFLDGDRELHSGWLCYELQRQLQMAKAVLKDAGGSINVELQLEHIAAFRLALAVERFWMQHASYAGMHEPIKKRVKLDDIYDYDGPKRNVVIPIVEEIMEEVGSIFGLSKAPPNLWDANGYLTYVKGLESQR